MPAKDSSPCLVVVVEDDLLLRMIAVETLMEAGLAILEAGNAAEALVHLEARAEAVSALLTDVEMPGKMDGVALAHHAFSRWPWIALMITSGRNLAPAATLPFGSRFFAKPYDPADLVAHIRTLPVRGQASN